MKIDPNKLLVSEHFYSVQGEGITSGVPAYFIRLTHCNLFSIGMKPSRRKPMIWTPSGRKVLNEIRPDDIIFAINEESGVLCETKVKAVFEYELVEHYEIKFEGKPDMFVSDEHPFLTTTGWKRAKDLRIGDEILHFGQKDVVSFNMKRNNPMKNPVTAKKSADNTDYNKVGRKVSKTRLKLFKEGKLEANFTRMRRDDPERYEYVMAQYSERMKNDNPMWDPEVLRKSNGAHDQNSTRYNGYHSKTEYDFHQLCNKAGLPVEYVGNYQLAVPVEGGKRSIYPDFYLPGTNRVFEVYHTGDTGSCVWLKDDGYRDRRNKLYESAGYHCTFVDFTELTKNDINDLIYSEIQATNGIKVSGVKKIEDGKYPSTKKKPIKFYDITCFPHHNFIVDGLITHNCGATPKFVNQLKKGELQEDPGNFQGDLHEANKASWTCDTIPVWIRGTEMEFQEMIDSWKEQAIYEDICNGLIHIIWTGGEPTLPKHQESIVNFNKYWANYIGRESIYQLVFQEIETNGTVYIEDELFNCIDQINCSPKLSNSGQARDKRIVPAAIKRIMEHPNYQFKFVISTEDDIFEMFDTYIRAFQIPLKNVVCMPGLDDQDNFHERTRWVLEMARKYKFIGLTRLHVSAWNKTTGV